MLEAGASPFYLMLTKPLPLILVLVLASGGVRADALDCADIRAQVARPAASPMMHYAMAHCAALDKNADDAFAFLASAADRGLHDNINIETDKDFAALHADPRWRPVVARLAAIRSKYLATVNHELRDIYQADQADRAAGPAIDWSVVAPRDAARRQRVRTLADAGALKHSDDYLHAAFVMQHGDKPEHYHQAHLWALKAAELDRYNKSARWLACAAEDRWLQSTGKPQVWGTQFGPSGVAEPFDRAARTDAQRAEMGVPTIAEMDAMMASLRSKK